MCRRRRLVRATGRSSTDAQTRRRRVTAIRRDAELSVEGRSSVNGHQAVNHHVISRSVDDTDAPPSQSQRGSYLAELWQRREFAVALAFGNLKARNVATSLGILWWMLNPILLGAVYFLVFGVIFGVREGTDDYLAYLLSGLFAFHYTGAAMTGSVTSILGNAQMLVNLRFPRLILPIAALVEAGVGFMASILAFYVIVGPVEGVYPGPQLLLLPVVFLLHTAFNLGLAGLAARLAIPFRDFNNLIPFLVRLWLYLSPILWPIEKIENTRDTIQFIAKANPLFPILSLYRSALAGTRIEADALILAAVWAVVMATIGITAFVRHEGDFARYL